MDQNLEQDLWQSNLFLNKIRTREDYAQNVYAALCNMRWQPAEVWPVLTDEYWSCSWRGAGGLVAEWRNTGGDYMDWYCSGMGGVAALPDDDEEELEENMHRRKYVNEGVVTEEIEQDLNRLGWFPIPWPKDEI